VYVLNFLKSLRMWMKKQKMRRKEKRLSWNREAKLNLTIHVYDLVVLIMIWLFCGLLLRRLDHLRVKTLCFVVYYKDDLVT